MQTYQGYLCLIQFCPDRSRLESVNVGLVVFCPALDLLEVCVTDGDDRAARFFGPTAFRPDLLQAAKRALVHRLHSAELRPRSLEELQQFVATRGNDLLLTPPRSMQIEEPTRKLDDLFRRLVLDPQTLHADAAVPGMPLTNSRENER